MKNSSRCDYCINPADETARLVVHFNNRITRPNLCLNCLFMCILCAKKEVKSKQIEENGVLYTHHYAPDFKQSISM